MVKNEMQDRMSICFWVQLFYCFILFLTEHHINTLWKCWVPVPVVTSSTAETRFWWKCECTLSPTSNRNVEFLCLCYLVHSRNQVLVKGQAVGQTAADGGQHWQHIAHNLVGVWEKASRKFKGDQTIFSIKKHQQWALMCNFLVQIIIIMPIYFNWKWEKQLKLVTKVWIPWAFSYPPPPPPPPPSLPPPHTADLELGNSCQKWLYIPPPTASPPPSHPLT